MDMLRFLDAIDFAADKHKFQRRKGYLKIPYINHPVKVCKILTQVNETDEDLLLAAILHDTLEDTDAKKSEIIERFGTDVCKIVMEDTDDMDLPEKVRKQAQIDNASKLSHKAKLIRIADKIANITDVITYPIIWSRKKKLRYVEWSMNVFEGCRGQNELLDQMFIDTYERAKAVQEKK